MSDGILIGGSDAGKVTLNPRYANRHGLIAGATGTGKSTSLAAMIGYRNRRLSGHIISIEDPIEYKHFHGKSCRTSREV